MRPVSRSGSSSVHVWPAFEIMPGTSLADTGVDDDPFTQEPLADSAGG